MLSKNLEVGHFRPAWRKMHQILPLVLHVYENCRYRHLCFNSLISLHNVPFSFQRLIVSIISSTDEDGDISLKDSQSLVNVILLLAHHLDPDGQQVTPQNLDILMRLSSKCFFRTLYCG